MEEGKRFKIEDDDFYGKSQERIKSFYRYNSCCRDSMKKLSIYDFINLKMEEQEDCQDMGIRIDFDEKPIR
jgi:hypothetical protein